MKHKKLKICTVLLFSLYLTTALHAQQTIPASGGNASGSGGSVSYSVGQMVYTTNTGTNGSIAQGVQQPYEISETTGLEEAKGINLEYTAYPNPTTDLLTLKISVVPGVSTRHNDIENLSYQLFDINGILLESKKLAGNSITISMANLASATYFLKVYSVGRNDRTGVVNDQKELKTFKIIKN
ncbi:MAG: T9SS type A sorting domain-containing protein [Bacteroidetes bacterium]|nr:T9SS type A sorting domain-containing protein [Bacteroidota bacterium]